MKRILIIDDDMLVRDGFRLALENYGFSVLEANSGEKGLRIVEKEQISAALLDLKMPGLDGLETLKELKKVAPLVPVIMITGYGDIPSAVEATKLGASDFITKPPNFSNLIHTLMKIFEHDELKREVNRLHTIVSTSLESLLGKSEAIKDIIEEIEQVALSNFSIIIQGETGTGKTYTSRVIHNLSSRAENPFFKVDMGTFSESIIESELFGHVKGAFAGADRKKKGYFESANGGTLFIDEVENMPLSLQAKLLSAVEERSICYVGSNQPIHVDVRIITATNENMEKLVEEGKFRKDLYFRLNEFTLTIPSLSERKDDIPFLANKFMVEACDELNKRIDLISEEAMNFLKSYAWPGNIRELKNVIRRVVVSNRENIITPESLKPAIGSKVDYLFDLPLVMPLKRAVKLKEIETIRQAIELCNGNKTKAADLLKISYRRLLSKVKEYEINSAG